MHKDIFVKTNERLINLQNVSNINIVDSRIVFNMNYGIEMDKRGVSRIISDYVYLDSRDEKDFELAQNSLTTNKYIAANFISHDFGYININEISSIKFSDKKLRVIFNLSHSVSFIDYHTQEQKLTSEFVYVDFNNQDDYQRYVKNVKNILLGE